MSRALVLLPTLLPALWLAGCGVERTPPTPAEIALSILAELVAALRADRRRG